MSLSGGVFIQSMRWFGPKDPVSLAHLRQAGCTHVVSALHHIPVGEVWSQEEISFYKNEIKKSGLHWEVVESLPVHEEIKTGTGNRDRWIEQYKSSLRHLGAAGIKVVTYNFMPVLDWVRTDVAYELESGATTLRFSKRDLDVFDLFMLNRPGAAASFSSEELEECKAYYEAMPETERRRIFSTIAQGLPGSDIPFTAEQILSELDKYGGITTDQLKANLYHFLREVAPVAEEAGVQLAIHPDDPPFSVLGLPRIMSTTADIHDLFTAVPNPANGLCFCTGSLGARADNDLLSIVQDWAPRIYFLHLRNTTRAANGDFMEADHLGGDTDMYAVVRALLIRLMDEKRNIPVRPDHGYAILDDLGKKVYPGYTAIGRLKGLAELRGLEYGLLRELQAQHLQSWSSLNSIH